MALAAGRLSRQSFLYRELTALGATFEEVAGCDCAMDFGDPEAEIEAAKELGLSDLSPLPRAGFKGRGALDWLRGQGIELGEDDNRAYLQGDGALAARIAPTEAVVLAALDGGGPCARLEEVWSMDGGSDAYPVPRAGSSAWLMVSGRCAAPLFAKLCGVDLRPAKFANHTIAQTSLARLNAIVIRDDLGAVAAYHVLFDSASAGYMWRCLRDAMDAFSGRPVGLTAMRSMDRE